MLGGVEKEREGKASSSHIPIIGDLDAGSKRPTKKIRIQQIKKIEFFGLPKQGS